MTKTENERLAVVETIVSDLKEELKEIKADVKALLRVQAQNSGAVILIARAAPWLALLISAVALMRS